MKTKTLLILFGLALFANGYSQFYEIPLDSANVFAGGTHYQLPTGNQTNAGAQVNDPFAYDPNDPMSAYPNQAWANYPDYTYIFMRAESVPENHFSDPSFPRVGVDSNFLAVTFDIPEGTSIRFLDCWGQNQTDKYNACQDLVIILKNDVNTWYFDGWNGVSRFNSEDQGFGRFDFKDLGIPDNLLEEATQVAITKHDRRFVALRLAEFRLAGEANNFADDHTAPVLSNVTSGEIYYDFEVNGQCNEEATVYLVEEGTYSTAEEIQMAAIERLVVDANTNFEVAIPEMEAGTYHLIAMDKGGNLSELSSAIVFTPRPPSTSANIVSLEFLNATALSTVIDTIEHTVVSVIDAESEVNDLFTIIEVSEGAICSVNSYEFIDFTNDVALTVTAEDATTVLDWTIQVSVYSDPSAVFEAEEEQFKFYPNPVENLLQVSTNLKEYCVQIFNINGQMLLQESNCTTMDLSPLESGLYIINFLHAKGKQQKKLLKR